MEVRYLVIVMMVPLLLGGCSYNDRNEQYEFWNPNSPGVALLGLPLLPLVILERALTTPYGDISDEDLCKRYSHTHKGVAKAIERRKLDCSKLNDSTSSK